MENNKFEHQGQFIEGCSTGVHLLGKDPTLEVDGELTKFVSICGRCGARIEVSTDLKLNKYIMSEEQKSRPHIYTPPAPQESLSSQNSNSDNPENDPLVRSLFGK